MERKLIKHGPSSHIVVLPAKWVADNKLQPGDTVSVEPHTDHVVISTKQRLGKTTAELHVDGLDRTSIMLAIRAAYRQGHHTINVNHSKQTAEHLRTQEEVSIHSIVHTEVNRLIGIEITEQRTGQLVIQELSTPSQDELRSIYRKLFTITNQLILQLPSPESSDIGFEERHDVITRLASFVIRTGRNGARMTSLEREQLLHTASSIDTIIDIIKYYQRHEKNTPKEFATQLSHALQCVEQVVFARKQEAMRAFQEHKAALRKNPVERLDPVVDILSDIIVSHAYPLKNMNV